MKRLPLQWTERQFTTFITFYGRLLFNCWIDALSMWSTKDGMRSAWSTAKDWQVPQLRSSSGTSMWLATKDWQIRQLARSSRTSAWSTTIELTDNMLLVLLSMRTWMVSLLVDYWPPKSSVGNVETQNASTQLKLHRLQENSEWYLSTEWLRKALEVFPCTHSRVDKLFPYISQSIFHEK